MKRPAFLTAAAAALLAAATASAQTPTVEARIVPDSIGIGDTFTLEIDVERDQVQVTEFPLYENDDKLEVVQSLPVDTLSREGRRLRLRKRYVMQAFSEGRYNLGRPGVLYADKNIVDTLYTSDSLRLDVGTFQIDTAKQTIYDLKPQRTLPLRAEEITMTCVTAPDDPHARDRAIDRVVLSRRFGIPLMLLLLALVFWLTLSGANTVSAMLSGFLLGLEAPLRRALTALSLPPGAVSLLTDGVWRVLATVVSVMLPPMAIFFPLFTLLEDAGYLPRIALQLDHAFCRAGACGKQSLSMCLRALRAQKTGPDEASDPVEGDIQISLPRVMSACNTNGINSVMSAA